MQILTVHAAKGLEWDVVAVAGLSADAFPARADQRPTTGCAASACCRSRCAATDRACRCSTCRRGTDGKGVARAMETFNGAWRRTTSGRSAGSRTSR